MQFCTERKVACILILTDNMQSIKERYTFKIPYLAGLLPHLKMETV